MKPPGQGAKSQNRVSKGGVWTVDAGQSERDDEALTEAHVVATSRERQDREAVRQAEEEGRPETERRKPNS